MRKPTTFELAGQSRSVVVTVGLAIEIENATGMGVIMLMAKLRDMRATLTECAAIVRAALAASGQNYTTDKVLAMGMDAGLIEFQLIAAGIVNALFMPPESDDAKPAKKGKQSAAPLERTTP